MSPTTGAIVVGALIGAMAMAAAQPQQPAQAPAPARQVDPKADALLRKMSADLAAMKRFRVDAESMTEVVTEDGEKLHSLATSTVTVQRPSQLRSDRKGPAGDVTLYYDGKNLTVYGKRDNLYATSSAPPTLDQAIDFARDKLGLEAPAADLLYSDAYTALMEDVVSGKYVDDAFLDGRTCHHLAYRGNETDWEIWIAEGPQALPCRFVITSKHIKGVPDYEVELRNWQVDPQLPASTFTFTPPQGASQIDFLSAMKKRGGR